jgi:hypothetical protein
MKLSTFFVQRSARPAPRRSPAGWVAASVVISLLVSAAGFSPMGRSASRPAAARGIGSRVGLDGGVCDYGTIGAALAAAASGATIYLSPGTYNEVLGTVDKDVHLMAASADCTTPNALGVPSDYVIDGGGAVGFDGGLVNIAANRTVTFTTLTLQNAQAVNGGLVYVSPGAAATFSRVRLLNGTATNRGGLLYEAAGATLVINNTSRLLDGTAGNAGGGLYLEGEAVLSGVNVQNSQAAQGGGVALAGAAHLVVTYSHLGNGLGFNTAAEGGGVHVTGQASLDLAGGTQVGSNVANVSHGGGIYASGDVTVTLESSARVFANDATAYGGGIYAADGATIRLSGTSQLGDANPAWGNTAVRGGGLYATGAVSVTVQGEAAIAHNGAGDGGGGIYLADGAPLLMTGGSLNGNTTTGWGGGLAIEAGRAQLSNTVISENEAMDGGGVAVGDAIDNEFVGFGLQIISNTAALDGGGVHVDQADVGLIDFNGTSRLSDNHAGGNGGGLFATGDAFAALATGPGGQFEIDGNTAGGDGGGLYFTGPTEAFVVGAVWLTDNTALGSGGGWYQAGGRVRAGGLSLASQMHVSGNVAANGQGGGLYLSDVSSAPGDDDSIIGNAVLSGNQADLDGGALYAGEGSYVQVLNALVQDNQAGQDGGGLFISAARVDMGTDASACQNTWLAADHYCSEFRNNSAAGDGGAVSLAFAATLSLSRTAVISNSAALGSGVMSASNGDHLEISNSLFTDNTGKALYLAADAELELIQTTFAANAWAIDINDNGATAEMTNNIIWDNGFGVETAVAPTVLCSISQNGVGGAKLDPLFHSTGRGAYRLASGSAAIDACAFGAATDLDGLPRPQGALPDMGAFEAGLPLVLFAPLLETAEGNAGVTPAPFVLALSETSTQAVTLTVQAVNQSALAGQDYAPLSLTVVFAAGSLSQTVPVGVMGDSVYENDETLEVQLGGAVGAWLGATAAVVAILNDDALPQLTIAPTAQTLEGDSGVTQVTVTVSLDHASAFTITVDFASGNDTALAGEDYTAQAGTLTFAPGALSADIRVLVQGDEVVEADEQFVVYVHDGQGAVLPVSAAGYGPNLAVVTILNDDTAAWTLFLPMVSR